MYTYHAEIVRMVDADTVEARLDLGFNIWHRITLRLAGVDAAERHTDLGKEAMSHLRSKYGWPTRADMAAGDTAHAIIRTEKHATGKYGRYIAHVECGGEDVGQELVKRGFAVEKEY